MPLASPPLASETRGSLANVFLLQPHRGPFKGLKGTSWGLPPPRPPRRIGELFLSDGLLRCSLLLVPQAPR